MNILVVKPSSLGDIVHALPAVELIRRALPEAMITWVVNDAYAELVGLSQAVDEVIVFRRQRWGRIRHWPELLGFVRDLRRQRYDLVLDLQGLLRSGLISLLARSPRRVGFRAAREGASLLYTEKVLLPANLSHAVDRNLFLVRSALGITAPAGFPEFARQHDFAKGADALCRRHSLDGPEPVLAVAPAARWPSKTWPAAFFAAVIDAAAIQVPGLRVWILGTRDEAAIGQEVIAACRCARPVALMGETDLGTLLELLRRSDVLLTGDTGPMHLAAALHTATVALFGPTDPSLTGPYGEGHTVFRGTCEQAPCFEAHCGHLSCQAAVPADQVAAAVAERCLARSRVRRPPAPVAAVADPKES